MNASALLSKQGWRGSGYSLDQSNRGLAKPLLVSRKVDALGLGTKKDDFSNQWWLKAWDTPPSSQAPTPPSETAAAYLPHNLNSRISGKGGLYSNFIKAETLGGTINETPDVPSNNDKKDKMTDIDSAGLAKTDKKEKKEKRDNKEKKRKREEEPSANPSSEKKSKKEKKGRKDRKAKDLTPSAEDVEDIFFVDTTGSATAPAKEASKPAVEVKREKAAAISEKRIQKLEAKKGAKKSVKQKDKKIKKTKSDADMSVADGEAFIAASPQLVRMDIKADFVPLGDGSDGANEKPAASAGLSARKAGGVKLPRSTLKFQARKARREARDKGIAYNDNTDPTSSRGKTNKKTKAKFRTDEEKAAAAAARPKVNKQEKYERQRKLREEKRAWKAKHMTPEQLAAQEEKKKEMKQRKKERLAEKEQEKLSRNQRKARKKAMKKEWKDARLRRVPAVSV